VYVYFDNDAKVRAPIDAQNLIRRVDELLQPANATFTGARGRPPKWRRPVLKSAG
jgi:hypothetical protein